MRAPPSTPCLLLSLSLAACGPAARGGTASNPGDNGGSGDHDAGPEDIGPPPGDDVAPLPEQFPKIAVSPRALTLPPTLPGEESTVEVVVANQGEAQLMLESIQLITSRPDELTLVDRAGRVRHYRCPCGPFGHRQQQEIPLRYRPATREPLTGSLRIASNDLTQPLVTVPIQSVAPAPRLELDPAALTWAALDPAGGGGCEHDFANRLPFDVRNAGSDDLFVTAWVLAPEAQAAAFEVCPNRWGLDNAYAPGQERTWRVVFAPTYPGTYEATLSLSSTGGDAGVQLRATDVREPHLGADPPLLAWPLLQAGATAGLSLSLSNDGTFPTTVSALTIAPAEAAAAYELVGEAIDPETGGLLAPIPVGGRVELEVVHTAPDAPLEATLLVEHDATDVASPLVVRLLGTSPIPMLETAPAELVFVDPPAGEPVTKHLRLHNPGREAVQVWNVGLGPAPGELPAPLPPFAIDPDHFQATLDPGSGRVFAATYTREAGMAADQAICFTVESDDPRRNDPLCTLVRSVMVHEGAPPVVAAEVLPAAEVPVGTLVTLDASASSDPDAGDAVAGWRWLVLARPDGSATALEVAGATATLSTDVPGDWEVALEITDTTGLTSGEARLTFSAAPPPPD